MSHKLRKPLRIGIFSGAFNPVHAGHIAFALQALDLGGLDEVVFLPERQPRRQYAPEHFAHRVAMLNRAIRPYRQFSVLELADRHLSVVRTWPQLQALFAGHELVMLVGSDVVYGMQYWPHVKRLLARTELLVGVRSHHSLSTIDHLITAWRPQPRDVLLIDSYAADISSAQIRQALRHGEDRHVSGLLASVREYANREWLYVSPIG